MCGDAGGEIVKGEEGNCCAYTYVFNKYSSILVIRIL